MDLFNDSSLHICRISSSMSSLSHKSDDGVPPLYRQGGSLSKVCYFKDAHFKINFDDLFRDFLEAYRHVISFGVHVKHVKKDGSREPCSGARRTIKFHLYYFVLGFTFFILHFFQEVLYSMKCALTHYSLNAVCVMVRFLNLSQFFDLDLTVKEFWYFFDIGHIDRVGYKGDHDWANETLEISGEWESNSSPELHSEFGSTPKITPDIKKVHVALGGKKKSSTPTQEMSFEKKLKTFSTACEGPPNTDKLVITLISSNEKKDEAARSELMTPVMLKVVRTIVDRIDQRRAESMLLNQNNTEAAKEMTKIMAAEASSSVSLIKRLKSELITLKGSNISAPTSLELQTARQKIIQDLERVVSELHSTVYTKDKEFIVVYNQMIHFKKKDVDKLQCVRVSMLKENKQLKGEKVRLEGSLIQSQINFYKLGYIGHLFGKPSDFEFVGKDFETFSISSENLLAFTFDASIDVPLLDLFVVHGGEGVTTLASCSADLVWTFSDKIRLLGAFFAGHDKGSLSAHFPFLLEKDFLRQLRIILLDASACPLPWGYLRQIFAYELQAVVCDDGLRDAKTANDVPPYEAFYLRLSCGCHGLCFHPFGEVVSCHNYHVFAPNNGQHWPYQVDCPLYDWPMTRLRV
ncbi:paramyosin-like [Pyrus ussuriensis x Pyrus communis]|uniref:Paramyosin-like n=1 Tax=Pyrus ussuriensis x Pyrus communis TaxID=2448454 RepID=A0A5N5FZL5_9ROSA|nr:paramyosin-like [Pyrus ussuriensis x Pyrus communis]